MENHNTATIPLFQVDAFADKPFSGNPAAVCLLENPMDEVWMQSVAAHCTLAPFWAERLGKTKMLAYQASQRGGELAVELQGDRVLLTGEAVTVLKGELYV